MIAELMAQLQHLLLSQEGKVSLYQRNNPCRRIILDKTGRNVKVIYLFIVQETNHLSSTAVSVVYPDMLFSYLFLILPFNLYFSVFKPEELRQALMPTLESLYRQDPESLPFRQPVDPLLLGIPVCSVPALAQLLLNTSFRNAHHFTSFISNTFFNFVFLCRTTLTL